MSFLNSKQVCTLAHILWACRVVLQQGRFIFCHDAVVRVFVSLIRIFLISYKGSKTKFWYIKFIKAGSRLSKLQNNNNNCGLLHTAPDYVLLSDFESSLIIPPAIAISQLRPGPLLNIHKNSNYSRTYLSLWGEHRIMPCYLSLENMTHFVQQLKQTAGPYTSLLWK